MQALLNHSRSWSPGFQNHLNEKQSHQDILKQYEIAEESDAASFIQFPSLPIPCINVNGSSH